MPALAITDSKIGRDGALTATAFTVDDENPAYTVHSSVFMICSRWFAAALRVYTLNLRNNDLASISSQTCGCRSLTRSTAVVPFFFSARLFSSELIWWCVPERDLTPRPGSNLI